MASSFQPGDLVLVNPKSLVLKTEKTGKFSFDFNEKVGTVLSYFPRIKTVDVVMSDGKVIGFDPEVLEKI